MEKIVDDWFSDNCSLFDEDIDEYYISQAKHNLIEKLTRVAENLD